jgi:hypothetical protein
MHPPPFSERCCSPWCQRCSPGVVYKALQPLTTTGKAGTRRCWELRTGHVAQGVVYHSKGKELGTIVLDTLGHPHHGTSRYITVHHGTSRYITVHITVHHGTSWDILISKFRFLLCPLPRKHLDRSISTSHHRERSTERGGVSIERLIQNFGQLTFIHPQHVLTSRQTRCRGLSAGG